MPDQEKEAAITAGDLNLPKTLAIMAAGAAISPLADKGVSMLMNKIEEKSRRNREDTSWLKLVSKYPDLVAEDYRGNRELFATLHALFPQIADRPEAIIGAMRIAKDYSTGGLDPSTIGALSKATSDLRDKGFPVKSTENIKSMLDAIDRANTWDVV